MFDYFYSSARVRALEVGLLGREAMLRLSESASLREAYAMLEELGWTVKSKDGQYLREEMLENRLTSAYREILELTEGIDTRIFALWRYPYDCNNLKGAIKCFARDLPCEGLLSALGTVEAQNAVSAVRDANFDAFPTHMAQAASEAISSYAKTKNPQMIDLLLDRACYLDMLEAAEESGVEYAAALVRAKIDLINLVTCVRVMRMNQGEAGRSLLCDALLLGGTLSESFLMELYDMEERQLWERLLYTDYKSFSEAVGSHSPTLTVVERSADNAWMEKIKEAKFISCGPEVLIGFLLGVECEVRNLRVILAGLAAGISGDTVRERVRESYV